ncbi:MAG: hypothetical protein H6818_12720 [Phycisphaerales bacterium]|nr:hypothetical protein [Phycisphaerales bacterium]
MTSVTQSLTRVFRSLGIAAFAIVIPASFAFGQPHADVPLDPVQYSIDTPSPTVGVAGITPADVLAKPGPSIVIPAISLGLTPLDELDGLSVDAGEFLPGDPFVIVFSVSRSSTGLTMPDAALVAQNRPFNVFNQAGLNQAMGDLFMTTRDFDAGGLIPDTGGGRTFSTNNTLVINQGDTGGVDMDLKPEKAPTKAQLSGTMKDGVDAVVSASSASAGARAGGARGPGGTLPGGDPTIPRPVFFSLRRGSPSLFTLPGVPSGANIFFDAAPEQPGGETLFINADQLGLIATPDGAGDDISGFTVFLGGPGRGVTGPVVLFSLSPGSPSLGSTFSPADIFVSTGGGAFSRFAMADQLGLATTDAITGFTILKSSNVDQLVLDSAIQLRIPGDFDGDHQLTSTDCEAFVGCYSGDGTSYDDDGSVTHSVDVGPGAIFDPANLTIQAGDTVTWTWIDGPHNVVSGSSGVADGAFSSGPPTGAGSVFSVSFDAAFLNTYPKASYPYFSEPDIAVGMQGSIVVEPHPCATFDQDFDGDVDCDDWKEFRSLYLQLNGSICIPLTTEEFVAVLLCQPLHPAHPCIADMNNDGLNDGRDIHPFVQYLLNGG